MRNVQRLAAKRGQAHAPHGNASSTDTQLVQQAPLRRQRGATCGRKLAGSRTSDQGADFAEQALKVDRLGFKGIAANLNRPFALIFEHIGR